MTNTNDDKSRIRALFGAKATPQTASAPVPTVTPQTAPTRPPLKLGTVPIPVHLETRHILPVGTTGSGKSQAIYSGILTPIRQRNEPAIIIDHSAEFLQRYYRPDVDLIFNPFDARSVGWTPFNEIRRIYDFDRIARAIVPDVPGENQDWQVGAQQLLANTMRALWGLGKQKNGKMFRCNEALLWFLTEAPLHGFPAEGKFPNTLQSLVHRSTSQRLFEHGNEKQLVITLGILGRHLQPLTYLKDGDFSMTDYVKQFEKEGQCKSWLFLSYTDASYSAIAPLFSILVSCGIQSGLELSESRTRRFYYVLDEFSSLEKIDAIADALTKLRKRGGVVVAGIQSTAQLEEKNGEVGAQILLSCFGNVLMLRVADDKTAEKLSAMIGDVEQWETSTNRGQSTNADDGLTISEGVSRQKVIKRAVLPSQFMTLPDLQGYVRIAGTPQVHKTQVPVSDLPLIAKPEETRQAVHLDLGAAPAYVITAAAASSATLPA